MQHPKPKKNPYAVMLGALGGRAGKGIPKKRPKGFYERIAKLSHEARARNKTAKTAKARKVAP